MTRVADQLRAAATLDEAKVPRGARKGEFEIAVGDWKGETGRESISGWIVGKIGVAKDGRYKLTHIPSGRNASDGIFSKIVSLNHALLLASALDSVMSDSTDADVAAKSVTNEIVDSLRDYSGYLVLRKQDVDKDPDAVDTFERFQKTGGGVYVLASRDTKSARDTRWYDVSKNADRKVIERLMQQQKDHAFGPGEEWQIVIADSASMADVDKAIKALNAKRESVGADTMNKAAKALLESVAARAGMDEARDAGAGTFRLLADDVIASVKHLVKFVDYGSGYSGAAGRAWAKITDVAGGLDDNAKALAKATQALEDALGEAAPGSAGAALGESKLGALAKIGPPWPTSVRDYERHLRGPVEQWAGTAAVYLVVRVEIQHADGTEDAMIVSGSVPRLVAYVREAAATGKVTEIRVETVAAMADRNMARKIADEV